MSTLAVGFALAVRPVAAETITTDTIGLTTGEVSIPTGDGTIPAYRAMPSRGRSLPVVLVVQEIFGVHEHIKYVCRRFARLGYLAIAPELYARQGDVSKLSEIDEIRKVVSRVPDAQVVADLDDRRLGQSQRRRQHRKTWHHRVLLGRAHRLALCGP